jgi:GT2 family glycosyltransferase
VNNDIEVISPDWMEEMVSWAAQEAVGCVGAKLRFPNGTIQHAGVMLGVGGVAGHSHKYYAKEDTGYCSRLIVHQNVSAVTGACLFVRKKLFDLVGGLDEALAVTFNDVDLCLRISDRGYRVVFTPFAELYHHESVSRGLDDTSWKRARFLRESGIMQRRWSALLARDPFYSGNLTLAKEDFDLRWLDD